jgi:hypothetical protein
MFIRHATDLVAPDWELIDAIRQSSPFQRDRGLQRFYALYAAPLVMLVDSVTVPSSCSAQGLVLYRIMGENGHEIIIGCVDPSELSNYSWVPAEQFELAPVWNSVGGNQRLAALQLAPLKALQQFVTANGV